MGWKIPLRLLFWLCRLFLVFALAYWTLLTLVLVVPFIRYGLRGVEGKLVHLTMMGVPFDEWSREKTILLIHKMWETQFLMLALSWLAFSVHRRVQEALN